MTTKPRILIVEDEAPMQSVLHLLLQENFQLDRAENGREALRKVAAHRYDLVVIDVGLPDGNGYRLCEAIRQRPEGQALKLVFLTGYGSPEAEWRGYAAGADAYLVKPCGLRQLVQELRRVLCTPRTDAAL